MTPAERTACYQIGLAYGEAARSMTALLRGEPVDRAACLNAIRASERLATLPLAVPALVPATTLGAVCDTPEACPPGVIHALGEQLSETSLFLHRALLAAARP